MTSTPLSPERARLLAALRDRAAGAPLTATQQGIWLAEQLSPGMSGYHDTALLRIEGPLDTPTLRAALGDLAAGHEALRARITERDGQPRQFCDAPAPHCTRVDLSGLPEEEFERRLHRLVDAAASTPFALDDGPLWSAALVRRSPDVHVLVLVVHHLITDGRTHALMLKGLLAAYEARLSGTSPPREPGGGGYASWLRDRAARETRAVADGGALRAATELRGLPYRPALPGLDTTRPERVAAAVPVPAGPADLAAFDALCRTSGTTRFMGLAGLFALLVRRAARTGPAVLSVPLAGRYDETSARLLGCLVNLVPVELPIAADDGPRAAMAAAPRAFAAAFDRADVPYRDIARAAGAPLTADDPLTSVAVEEFNAPTAAVRSGSLRVVPLPRARVLLRHDLTLSVSPDGAELLYPMSRWSAEHVRRLAEELAESIRDCVVGPHHRAAPPGAACGKSAVPAHDRGGRR